MLPHEREFIRGELSKYPEYKQQLMDYEQERQVIAESYPAPGRFVAAGSRGSISDPTHRAAARLERLAAVYSRPQFYVRAIEDVLHRLPPAHQETIRLRYFKGLPPQEVAENLGVSRATFYNYEREALKGFYLRFGI